MSLDLTMLQTIAGWVLIGVGAVFFLIGSIGVHRMPDVFTRLHAVSIGDSFGAPLMLAGMMVVAGFSLVSAKLLLLILFLLLTGPVATHALARAALQAGNRPKLDDGRGGFTEAAARAGEGTPSKS